MSKSSKTVKLEPLTSEGLIEDYQKIAKENEQKYLEAKAKVDSLIQELNESRLKSQKLKGIICHLIQNVL